VDLYLYKFGFSKSRESAQKAIESGMVIIDGKSIRKASEKIDESVAHKVDYTSPIMYVGRGGLKLEAALDFFEINPAEAVCIDIGASTGGFTDCLLKRGASKVYAVDSGRDQLDPCLRNNPGVISLEGVNARYLDEQVICDVVDIIVMDVSFISQTLILPCLPRFLKDNGYLITLIKPQFECGREAVGKGGIIKKAEHRLDAVRRVVNSACDCGLYLYNLMKSPIIGGDGNIEFLALFRKFPQNNTETIISKVEYN